MATKYYDKKFDKRSTRGSRAQSIDDYRIKNAKMVNAQKTDEGYIYFLYCHELSIVKIGVTTNPKRRIRDIQGALPFESKVIKMYFVKNPYDVETQLHERYKDFYLKSEWLVLNLEQLQKLFDKIGG